MAEINRACRFCGLWDFEMLAATYADRAMVPDDVCTWCKRNPPVVVNDKGHQTRPTPAASDRCGDFELADGFETVIRRRER